MGIQEVVTINVHRCIPRVFFLIPRGLDHSKHKVDITESASAQFSIWIFNFWQYGQLKKWAVYEQILRVVTSCFHGQKYFFHFKKNIVASPIISCIMIRFYLFFEYFLGSKQATPQVLNPECKRKETLRQVLLYLFCDSQRE